MKMVSASKLRKANEAQSNAKSYAKHITDLISRVTAQLTKDDHPLLKTHKENNKALILVFTSDRGLCGAFNHNAHKQVLSWIERNQGQYDQIDVSCCGKKGYAFFQRRLPIKNHYENLNNEPSFESAVRIGGDLAEHFILGEYHEIYLVYNQFFSPLLQKSIFEKILPIDPAVLIRQDLRDDTKENITKNEYGYIFEPNQKVLLNYLIPHFLYFKVYFAMLENWAGEHGARMTSMDNATKNAVDLIQKNTLLRNRARQAAITTELTEIVAGAEALK